jgi:hypothetical protein
MSSVRCSVVPGDRGRLALASIRNLIQAWKASWNTGLSNNRMYLTRSAPATGTATLAGDPECSTD